MTKSFRPTVYTFNRSDKRSKRLVAMTAEFMKNSGAGPQDPFATYVRRSEKVRGSKAVSKRTVTAKDLTELRASANTLGLSADRFSPKSYRESGGPSYQEPVGRYQKTKHAGSADGRDHAL